ncbi:F-box domain-containing protein [Thelonectria olida]|uniref:F-box domain-containing protein n=1 Tax=Thelonectria olida TaxID=1576542 RepID=A0A9P9ASB6_9HYPO|nr:F-box domain-containing protein [Thelonectria olida]
MANPEAILRAVSYHCEDFGRSVIQIDSHHCDQVRSSIFKPFGDGPDAGLGSLDLLPVEILSNICLMLDVSAGFNFSQVNKRSRAIVASIPEYHQVGDHALPALCALLRADIGHHVAITSLQKALLTQDCQSCGYFAGYLFLPTLTKCCFTCIESAGGLSAAPLEKLANEVDMSADQLGEFVPIFHTLSSTNSAASAVRGGRTYLVSERHCIQVLRALGRPEPAPTYFQDMHLPGLGFEASVILPCFSPRTGEIQTGVSCRGCQMAMRIAPSEEAFLLRRLVYTREKFLDHFKVCEHAIHIWAAAQEGKPGIRA